MIDLGSSNTFLVKDATTGNVEIAKGNEILTAAMKLYEKQPCAIMRLKYKVVGTAPWTEVLFGGCKVMFADKDGKVHDCGNDDMDWVIRVQEEWLDIIKYNINELHDLF